METFEIIEYGVGGIMSALLIVAIIFGKKSVEKDREKKSISKF